jgi:hypothetical protein
MTIVGFAGSVGNVPGFRYHANTTELHVDPDIDVVESVFYGIISVSLCLLQRDIGVILGLCAEGLESFHTLGGMPACTKKSV